MSEPATSSIAGSLPSSSERSSSYALQIEVKEGEEKEDKMDTSSNQPTSIQDYTLVNIEDPELRLADVIKERLRDLDPISNASCICRVPPIRRQVSEKSYTPQTVSIGPFHHEKKELGPWEEYKQRYLLAFLDRTKKSLEECITLVKELEESARNCYRERIDLSSNEFIDIMLVDNCFIIEVMWRFTNNLGEKTDYLSSPELITIVARDLVLLENQIPFFVLQGLYKLGFSEEGEDKFIGLSINYLSSQILTKTETGDTFNNVKRHQESGFKIEHLTDLLRICHLPTNLENLNRGDFVPIQNAARLREAGMKFEIGTGKRLLDMKYNPTGLLEMPQFTVDSHTELLLRNLTALEMCHYPFDSYIIDYVFFMDKLIDTATDADLLIQKGIIVNALSDSAAAVASLFNNLTNETTLPTSYYFQSISKDINEYSDVHWHIWNRDYYDTAAAILVVVLTLISTICSIISVLV